jgi:hypothetical protein
MLQNALPVSFLLRKNSWDSILERPVTKIPLHILAVNVTLIWSGNSWKDEVKRLTKTSLSQYSIQFNSFIPVLDNSHKSQLQPVLFLRLSNY